MGTWKPLEMMPEQRSSAAFLKLRLRLCQDTHARRGHSATSSVVPTMTTMVGEARAVGGFCLKSTFGSPCTNIVRPDIAGWRRARLVDPWDRRPIDVTPDWVCEVISPSNAAHDRVTKRRLYARHKVPYYWLVDPMQRTLEVLKLVDGQWLELGSWGDGDVMSVEPFSDVELEVSRLFPPLL